MTEGEPPRLGELGNAQRYDARQIEAIARAAAPLVLGAKDAGKVFCPDGRLREARWKRSLEVDARKVSLLVYCTQCHKTGVTTIDLDQVRARRRRRRWAWIAAAVVVAGAALAWLLA